MSLFPADDAGRKALPIFAMIAGYFPKALREVTRVCVANNVRYSPDRAPTDIVWNRGKSKDQFGSLFRHLLERRVDDHVFESVSPEIAKVIGTPHVYVLAEAAWRALAALEEEIEQQEGAAPKWSDYFNDFRTPVCPICNYREHVTRSAEIPGAWKCSTGHTVFHFNSDSQPI